MPLECLLYQQCFPFARICCQSCRQEPGKHPDHEHGRKHDAELLTDFAQRAHYKEANLKLSPPAPGEDRVVFMGDSLTEGWHFEAPGGVFFAKPYINRGISGQTTSQMVLRFHQDVIALKPKGGGDPGRDKRHRR